MCRSFICLGTVVPENKCKLNDTGCSEVHSKTTSSSFAPPSAILLPFLGEARHISLRRRVEPAESSPAFDRSQSVHVDASQRPLSMVVPSPGDGHLSLSPSTSSLNRQVGGEFHNILAFTCIHTCMYIYIYRQSETQDVN